MGEGSTPHGGAEQPQAREMVMALIGLLSLAEAPNLTGAQRAEFATAAERQARLLRDLFPGPLLLVLAREHAHQAERLKQAFGSGAEIEVIIDRRPSDDQRAGQPVGQQDLWQQQQVDEDLRRIGAALVRLGSAPESASGRRAHAAGPVPSRVLLIDDDAAIIQMLSSHFQGGKQRYAVEAALSGEKGLAKLQARRPDVVLLDISMPGMSGLEVLARIRGIDPSIPVIMVTGANHQESSRALKNAFAYLPKPFDLRYVDHLVTLATDQSRR
ncbi:MAG TPA: response regulator [Methylomirabilota bacterium]|nr:response regulator [Methylomirabilota bacterium]